jgi:hypothetical protein
MGALHRLVYLSAIAGVVHFWMLVKSDTDCRSRSLLSLSSCSDIGYSRNTLLLNPMQAFFHAISQKTVHRLREVRLEWLNAVVR